MSIGVVVIWESNIWRLWISRFGMWYTDIQIFEVIRMQFALGLWKLYAQIYRHSVIELELQQVLASSKK